ncbi:hypothetical protein KEJ51_01985 [Candidatus Bathyarchaeota archaeon]|nr:hypothetical protein [Candidatus Bathyarchaeota archaeon]MBS7628417.1 hypothetical protein [Candidatus Bathyarchaeota archaeon]
MRFDTVLGRFKVNRSLPFGRYRLSTVFEGLEDSPVACKLLRGNSNHKLDSIEAEITEDVLYMRVDAGGRLLVNREYLKNGDEKHIYLDLIHELTHLKQLHEGLDIYNPEYSYAERPTELEAYANAVSEARRIGMSEGEIYEYLKVEWISKAELDKLAERLGVHQRKS